MGAAPTWKQQKENASIFFSTGNTPLKTEGILNDANATANRAALKASAPPPPPTIADPVVQMQAEAERRRLRMTGHRSTFTGARTKPQGSVSTPTLIGS